MAFYAYKKVVNHPDFKSTEQKLIAEGEIDGNGGANYAGEYWHVAARMIQDKDIEISLLRSEIEAAFRAGAEAMRQEICAANVDEIGGLEDRDEIWESIEDTDVDIDALWGEYRKGGE